MIGVGLFALAVLFTPTMAAASVSGDRIDTPLSGHPGDPVAGRAIVTNRQRGLCLLCHTGPFPEERFQGSIGPNLTGIGSRLDTAQLRLRIANARLLDPASPMPVYFTTEGNRVAAQFRGKPILSAAEIEDVVAFLATLKTP